MIARGLSLLTVLSSCVLSLPVTSSQLENVDVDVMKCIVEALADVLSRPHVMPVSQECLITLKTDDRLVAILRHHNFLRELQEIAFQGDQERAKLQGSSVIAPKTNSLQTADDSDQSMLEALGGPGERSILSQRKRTENGDGRAEKDESREDGESQEDGKAVEVKRGKEVQGGTEKREEEADEEERENSEELLKEKKSMDKKGDGLDEERDASRNKSKQRESEEQNEEEETEKTSPPFSQQHIGKEEEEKEREESKRGSSESLKQWAKRAEFLHLKKKAVGKETQQLASQNEVPHHSKEVMVEEMEEEKKKIRGVQRSPEEKELQMIARRVPEERRGIEEEGSASRKPEEPDIESLAAIESELENVAQKLHELRQG